MAEVVSTNQFRNGMHVELDGAVWRIVEFQHVKPGKGGAFVRTKLKALDAGSVVDRTFRAGEKFPRVRTETKNVQYLYDDGSDAHFMDEQSFEQIAIPESGVGERLKWIKPNESVDLLYIDGEPNGRVEDAATGDLEVGEARRVQDLGDPKHLAGRELAAERVLREQANGGIDDLRHVSGQTLSSP